jgi:hypothetical protein
MAVSNGVLTPIARNGRRGKPVSWCLCRPDLNGVRGDNPLARMDGYTIGAEEGDGGTEERIGCNTTHDKHVAEELGVPLPFQPKRSQIGRVMNDCSLRWFDAMAKV